MIANANSLTIVKLAAYTDAKNKLAAARSHGATENLAHDEEIRLQKRYEKLKLMFKNKFAPLLRARYLAKMRVNSAFDREAIENECVHWRGLGFQDFIPEKVGFFPRREEKIMLVTSDGPWRGLVVGSENCPTGTRFILKGGSIVIQNDSGNHLHSWEWIEE